MQTDAETEYQIIPSRHLLMLLGACVGLSYIMVPRQGELIERLFKDRQFRRVTEVLQDEAHGMSAGELNGLRELGGDQIEGISGLLSLTPREQLRVIFQSKRPLRYDAYIHHIVLAAVRFVDVLPPREALSAIQPRIDRVPPAMRVDIYRLIAHNFQALGDATSAADTLRYAALASPQWSLALEMAQGYRWSGRPGEGAKELKRWLSEHGTALEPDDLRAARSLNYALCMEGGDPSGAFDVSVAELHEASSRQPPSEAMMERSLDAALKSGRTLEFTPWVKRHVTSMPEEKLSLADLRARSLASPDSLRTYRDWSQKYAQWSDWASRFDDAFDAHLRLAAMGDLRSLDRCVALYDFLGRTEECNALLLALGELPARPQLALLCARQLAELDQDVEAKARFETWLKAHPEDRDARFDYCCLMDDIGDEDASRAAFEEMLRHHPNDVPAMKRLAEALILASDYRAALALYARMPESAHDHDTLENYAMIAESIDDHQAEVSALRLAAKLAKEPAGETYLDIAEAASYLDDPQPGIDALNEGLKRLPDSAQLRIALANTYLHADRPDSALAVLLDPVLKNNFEAVKVLLSLADEAPDPEKILTFLGDDIERRQPLSEHQRLQLGLIHHAAGHSDATARLIASVKESPSTYRLLAECRFALNDFSDAARLMDLQLKTHASVTSAEWLFMGDIYEQMGRFDEAKKAYDLSVAMLTADLPSITSN